MPLHSRRNCFVITAKKMAPSPAIRPSPPIPSLPLFNPLPPLHSHLLHLLLFLLFLFLSSTSGQDRPVVSFESTRVRVEEGANFDLVVRRSGTSGRPIVVVAFLPDASVNGGDDFFGSSGLCTLQPTESECRFVIIDLVISGRKLYEFDAVNFLGKSLFPMSFDECDNWRALYET